MTVMCCFKLFALPVLQNPDYMKENFILKIESMHIADRGDTENVGNLMFSICTL